MQLIKHNIFKNSIFSFLIQISNMLAPMLILPFLSRAYSMEKFGLFTICISLSALIQIILDYGFSLSSVIDVSSKLGRVNYINKYISDVYFAKFLIFLFLLPVLWGGVSFCLTEVSFLVFFIVYISSAIFSFIPIWFFQAYETMKTVLVYILTSKLIYLTLSFLFISADTNVGVVFIFMMVGNFIALVLSINKLYSMGHSFITPSFKFSIVLIKKNFLFFMSRASVSIYTSSSTFIVGSILGPSSAAAFSANERIYVASQSISNSLSQATLPFMSKGDQGQMKTLLLSILLVFIPLVIGVSVVFNYSDAILGLIYGDSFRKYSDILHIFLIITLITFISVNIGYPALSFYKKAYLVNYTVVFGAFFHLLGICFLYFKSDISILNLTILIAVTESLILSLRIFLLIWVSRAKKNNCVSD